MEKNAPLETTMCRLLQARGLRLPKGYRMDGEKISRSPKIDGDDEYSVQCIQMAQLDAIIEELSKIRRNTAIIATIFVIGVILAVLL